MTTARTPIDEATERRVEYRGSGFYASLAVILVIGIVVLVFAIQNTGDVAVDFLGWTFTMPLFAVAIGTGMVTIVLDQLVGLAWRRRRRRRLEERAELERLRSRPDDVDTAGDDGSSRWNGSRVSGAHDRIGTSS